MEAYTLEPKTKYESDALKAFASALKISISKHPYNAEFIKKIRESQVDKQKGKGRFVTTKDFLL